MLLNAVLLLKNRVGDNVVDCYLVSFQNREGNHVVVLFNHQAIRLLTIVVLQNHEGDHVVLLKNRVRRSCCFSLEPREAIMLLFFRTVRPIMLLTVVRSPFQNRPAMNYDKLSRSLRQYYKKGIMKKTERSQRLVYQFCHPYYLQAARDDD